ncbi:MAG: cupin domain-containing protein [Verrucomicrobia bacterium]|nr:cupin domain-containing protein [Verrucomicrobiota bacterium]
MTRKKTKPAPRPARSTDGELLGASTAGALAEDTARLALAAPVVAAPSASVKTQLLARIRAAKAAGSAAAVPAGWRFESANTAEGWRETFPGVRFKTLSVDEARDVVMLLVEMRPGARFPDHPHDTSADEGVVISGDVDMDGRLMRPGDYYYAGQGTMHQNVTSPSGCTALLSMRASAWRQWREKLTAR